MPVLYKAFQSSLEEKESGKKLFYPRVVRVGNVDSGPGSLTRPGS